MTLAEAHMSEIHPLRKARKRLGYTQEMLADFTQLSKSSIERAEASKPLSSVVIQSLCRFFTEEYGRKVTPEELGLVHETEQHKILSPMGDSITELLQPLVENRACAWTYAWELGEEVSNIELVYDSAIQYEPTMPDDVHQALDDWCKKNQTKCYEKQRDPVGALVRLEKAEWNHSAYKYFVLLSPSKYLLYVAIHPHLGRAQLRSLREAHFDNALNGLRNSEFLELPSHFALHMAVISHDSYLLLRRRASNTELYPSAWEAGIGEFMHGPQDTPGPEYKSGPYHAQFPHFTETGVPDLFLFLKNAVAEELGYHEARQENFRLYGFAVEYETLAPKLLVVCHTNCAIAELLESAKKARDRARELSSLELIPRALAEACSNSHYSSWGPTSKLVMLLALRQDLIAKEMEEQGTEITRLIDCFEPEKELADPWKFHE
jgi:DNA-binding XRE family transcriptional regulator